MEGTRPQENNLFCQFHIFFSHSNEGDTKGIKLYIDSTVAGTINYEKCPQHSEDSEHSPEIESTIIFILPQSQLLSTMRSSVFWHITPCSPMKFNSACYLLSHWFFAWFTV
jgi:hypothetical protein